MSVRRRGMAGGLVSAATFLVVLACAVGEVSADGHGPQVVPSNAVQIPGASFEHEPEVGRDQVTELVRESMREAFAQLGRRPIRAGALFVTRALERTGTRILDLLPGTTPARYRGPISREAIPGPPTPARITILPGSEVSIQALFDGIARAQRRIDLMMYGWQDDPTGREVAQALAARARAGVRVRLLVDRGGLLVHNPAAVSGDPAFLALLRNTPNVAIIEPPNPFFRFDHRKLAIFDDSYAWTGGMILTEDARRRWQNLAYLAEGPIVAQFVRTFAERWESVGGDPEPRVGVPATVVQAPPNATVRLIRTDNGDRSLEASIAEAIDGARHHIYLENPYFTDETIAAKLIAARERGVDVRVIITMRGNVRSINEYGPIMVNRLVRGGVAIYLYPIMTHVKAMTVDGTWSYIGTGNFDSLSLRNNREIGLSVCSPLIASDLERTLFLPDMAISQLVHDLMPRPEKRLRLNFFLPWL